MKAFVLEALSWSHGSEQPWFGIDADDQVAPLRRELPSCANGTLLATD
jgi:ribosomal protein S27AE